MKVFGENRIGEMRSLGKITGPIQERVEAARRRNREWRRDQVCRYGFDPKAQCMHCGDTGLIPGTGMVCLCAVGEGIAAERVQRATWETMIPDRYRHYTLDSHPDPDVVRQARAWIRTGVPNAVNLMIYGPVGTGKTGLAIGILRELHMVGTKVYYGNVMDVISDLWAVDLEDKKTLMTRMQLVPVMLIDDLGAEKSSDGVAQELYMLMEGRYRRKRPTIITTNRTESELHELVGRRAMSRLGDRHAAIVVGGRDRRRNAPYAL